jgi:putative transposase
MSDASPVSPARWRKNSKGSWKYLYRAVDKAGATVDLLLTAKRDCKAALRFLRKAVKRNGTPEKITIDKSGSNAAALESHNAETGAAIEIRHVKYLSFLSQTIVLRPSAGHAAAG